MVARARSFALLLLLGTIPGAAACLAPAVLGGLHGDDEGEGGSASNTDVTEVVATGAGEGVTVGGASTFALWNTQPVEVCEGCPEDLLWLVFDSDGASCEAPGDVPQNTITAWRVVIGLPPSRLTVGSHVLAEETDIAFTRNEAIFQPGNASVGVGGGPGPGVCVLDILEIDEDSLLVSLNECTSSVPSNNTYDVVRCEPLALPPEAIALPGSALGEGEGGGAPDPDALVIVVGDTLAACGDPLETACEGDTFQVAVTLPPEYLVTGLYSLADPRIEVTDCGEPLDLDGTIEILAIDDASLIVRLEGVPGHEAVNDQEIRTTRCP